MNIEKYARHYRGAKNDRIMMAVATLGILGSVVSMWDSETMPDALRSPKASDFAQVLDYEWKRTAFIEEYRETKASGWTVPDAGEVIRQETRVREQEVVPVMVGQIIPELSQKCGIPLEGGQTITTQCAVNGDSVYFVRDQKVWEQRPVTDTWYTWVIRGWEVVDTVETDGDNSLPIMPEHPEISEGQRVNCCHEVNRVEVVTPEGPRVFNLVAGSDLDQVVTGRLVKINSLRPVEGNDEVAHPPQSASEMLFEMYRER